MTLQQAYLNGKQILMQAANESPAFDAISLFQSVFGFDRQDLILHGEEEAEEKKLQTYYARVKERATGRPLQYILGKWPFMDFTLSVGEGVLVPREETELLVYTAASELQNKPVLIDLCGGSGAVAIGLATLCPDADITSVELYEDAWHYLTRNITDCGLPNVRARRLDVLCAESTMQFPWLDGIVSNPPYIETAVLPSLQTEVRNEPQTALDGGEDGLLFYRTIAQIWVPKLKPGGLLAVEIGEEQAVAVCELFEQEGIKHLQVFKDFNGFDRVVRGYRSE